MKLYELPECLIGRCDESNYVRWLRRKAQAHVIRDRKRFGHESCTGADYRRMIHEAVRNGGDRDYYTGLPLDWSLISVYDNDAAQQGGTQYLKRFGNLPTVDHTTAQDGTLHFVICSWRVNDCKSHLSEQEFWNLCEQVLAHRDGRARSTPAHLRRSPLKPTAGLNGPRSRVAGSE
jgi:hypothetical protein